MKKHFGGGVTLNDMTAADAIMLNERRSWRRSTVSSLIWHADGIPFWKRRWFRISEIADSYAETPGKTIKDREEFVETLRKAIVRLDFVDGKGRSKVLDFHESPLAEFRFCPDSARASEFFKPLLEFLWIRRDEWIEWFNKNPWLPLPQLLRIERPEALINRPAHEPDSFPRPVDDAVGDSEREASGHLALPKNEPRGREPLRAYRALLRQFPDGRIPNMSMQALANSLTPTLKKMDQRGGVSRDAVRRALALKK